MSKMKRFILSTVGTSLLTNRFNAGEDELKSKVSSTANLKYDELNEDIVDVLGNLEERAKQILNSSNLNDVKKASAELNGIINFYKGDLRTGQDDHHWLIATDTAQGEITSKLVKEFLNRHGLIVNIHTPPNLSAKDTASFSGGVKDLIKWCSETIPGFKESGHEIIFNLSGGFKSLQAFCNTIGMLYADDIIYIFESNAELLSIPRLPIQINEEVFQNDAVHFALLDNGKTYSKDEFSQVPEVLIGIQDNKVIFSLWGQLLWEKSKEKIFQELLSYPCLIYEDRFERDFKNISKNIDRVKLQETLATVSKLLIENNGNIASLKTNGGLLYENYATNKDIGHFRVTQGLRVSCIVEKGKLRLRRYGKEEEVDKSP